jgi:hypothetical protein
MKILTAISQPLLFLLIKYLLFYLLKNSIYRITGVLKVETDIFSASLTGRTVMLVIMYVKIFKTGVIVFIGEVKICFTSHWPIIFNIRVNSYACELLTDLILLWIKVSSVILTLSAAHIKGKMSNLPINIIFLIWHAILNVIFKLISCEYNIKS